MRRVLIAAAVLAAGYALAFEPWMVPRQRRVIAASSGVPTDGLVCWYDGTIESNILVDAYGDINGTISDTNSIVSSSGIITKSSAASYANMGPLSYSNMTVAIWLNDQMGPHFNNLARPVFGARQAWGTERKILTRRKAGSTNCELVVVHKYNGGTVYVPQTPWPATEWVNIAVSFSVAASETKIYINGVLTTNVSGVVELPPYDYYVLNCNNGSGPDGFAPTGWYDDFYLWNRILSDDEISLVYEAGVGKGTP
jgi:hypothetical protein